MWAHLLYWSLVYRRQRFHLLFFSFIYLGTFFSRLDFFHSFIFFPRLLSFAIGMNGKMKLFTSPSAFPWMVFLFAQFLLQTPKKKIGLELKQKAVFCDYHNVNIFAHSYMPSIDNDMNMWKDNQNENYLCQWYMWIAKYLIPFTESSSFSLSK